MVVALLTLLGVPIWLTLGWLAGALWHRVKRLRLPGDRSSQMKWSSSGTVLLK
jgi:hypothetical protein